MKLQSKVMVVLASVWLVICLIIYIDSKMTMQSSYEQLEKKIAFKDIQRAEAAITNKLAALKLYTNSWSQWDDAYDFMSHKTDKFISSNFVPGTFTSSNINFFLFYDQTGKFYYGKAYNLNKKEFTPIPSSLLAYLDNNKKFVTHDMTHTKYVGMIKLPNEIVAMSSLPVTTGDGQGPIRGTLLMGYVITPSFFDDISRTIQLKAAFLHMPDALKNTLDSHALKELSAGKKYYFETTTKGIAYGFFMLRDVNNQPIGMVKIEIPRLLYIEGLTTIYHYLVLFVIVGVIVIITMMLLLKSFVLNRVTSVIKQVIDINSQNKFNSRINIKGSDELATMVASLNSMLELIELTQDQLKYRISKRTKEFEKLTKLNRNLFYEMSKQKSIESKLREDEKLLRQMAYYDSLTGLPNRNFFNELLLKAMTIAEHHHHKIAVIFVDMDKFKKLNDTYGHEFGDKFLKQIAVRMKNNIKDTDIAARLSGDEFIIFLTNIEDKAAVVKSTEQLLSALNKPLEIDKITISPVFSMGISLYPDNGVTVEELTNQADLAMYYAKKNSGSSYCFFDEIKKRQPEKPTPA